tara:strand:+ start:47 stop:1165 length:1119 start_codon:yes stop_codon:yes gene_type:complete
MVEKNKNTMSKNKIALITGITGQDGSYLAEFLLDKGYIVHGIKRRSSSFNTERIDHLYQEPQVHNKKLILHYGDLSDSMSLVRIIQKIEPNEIYNLGAQSHVAVSFETPEYTADTVGLGALRILEAIRISGFTNKTRYYQASSSELYGLTHETPQNELTKFYPRSPYAAAKLYAYWITINYREAYGIYACNGILFNHESPVRGETFVTRKITRALARISLGLEEVLYLGNLDAKRDWGHARDYVEMQWLMLQQDSPDDFCISTGIECSVRQFVDLAWSFFGKKIRWQGKGIHEKGYDENSDKLVVKIDSRYFRPTEVDNLLGDSSKAREKLGWEPKISLQQLVDEMMENDLNIAKRDKLVNQHGYRTFNHKD